VPREGRPLRIINGRARKFAEKSCQQSNREWSDGAAAPLHTSLFTPAPSAHCRNKFNLCTPVRPLALRVSKRACAKRVWVAAEKHGQLSSSFKNDPASAVQKNWSFFPWRLLQKRLLLHSFHLTEVKCLALSPNHTLQHSNDARCIY